MSKHCHSPERIDPMSPFIYRTAVAKPWSRSLAIAALLGATLLAAPLAAQPAPRAAAKAADSNPETVEQRITGLHASLQITAGEEANWTGVAQAMRDNAAAMEKLIAERTTDAADKMTAPEKLDAYGKFAQAHADGVKNLTTS